MNKVYNADCIEYMKSMEDNCIDLVVTDPPYLIQRYINECYRVMKDNTAIYMFCSWHHVDLFKQAIESKFKLKNIIVWNKNNHGSGDLKASYAPKYEFILYAHKGRSLFRDKRIADVIDCAKVSSKDLTHPTEKPIDLLKRLIEIHSNKESVVLDCFGGSFSTGLACLELEREFIGIEIDTQFYLQGKKRVEEKRKEKDLQTQSLFGNEW